MGSLHVKVALLQKLPVDKRLLVASSSAGKLPADNHNAVADTVAVGSVQVSGAVLLLALSSGEHLCA